MNKDNNENKRMELMKNGPVKKTLLTLAVPSMIGMVVSALYNLVDTMFVGIMIIGFAFMDEIMRIMGDSSEVLPYAKSYSNWLLLREIVSMTPSSMPSYHFVIANKKPSPSKCCTVCLVKT